LRQRLISFISKFETFPIKDCSQFAGAPKSWESGVFGDSSPIKNSFIWEFEHAKICDIPEGYKKYFDIKDFSSTDLIPKEIVYEALKRKFENEVYLVVDAKEGEDFLPEEINGLGSNFDIIREGRP